MDSPRQREAYDWFTVELANLRTAFRWAADHGDLDAAAAIASYAGLLGYLAENYEPIAWVEEIIEPARAVDHPRLAFLYVIASQCYATGRTEDAVRYSEAGQMAMRSGRGEVPLGLLALLMGAYVMIGQPKRAVELCRAQLAGASHPHAFTRTALVIALKMAGFDGEAMAAATGLIDAAEATHNPWTLSYALLAYSIAFRDADSDGVREALRRGLIVTQDSGNRGTETHMTGGLSRIEAQHGDPLAALEYLTLAIRNYHDSGNTTHMRAPLGCSRNPLRSARAPRISGHSHRFRAQPPNCVDVARNHHHDHPPPRCPRRGDLRIARPQG